MTKKLLLIFLFCSIASAEITRVTSIPPLRLYYKNGTLSGHIDQADPNTGMTGVLSYGDWATFNNKQDALYFDTNFFIKDGNHITIPIADTDSNGLLSFTDWNTFNSKQPAGSYLTAETDPVVGAITGLVKANGTGAISAASAGTDYDFVFSRTGTTISPRTDSNLNLPTTSSTVGQYQINGSPVLHTYTHSLAAEKNVFVGGAGNFTLHKDTANYEGSGNVGLGQGCLVALTHGFYNMGLGTNSFLQLTTGKYNTAVGVDSGAYLTSGQFNTYIGYASGNRHTGSYTINIGAYSGRRNTSDYRLIIDSISRADIATEISNSIIYGVMAADPANQTLRLNALVGIGKDPTVACDVTGEVNATTGYRINGTAGASGTFTSADGKTITVTNGIITAITGP